MAPRIAAAAAAAAGVEAERLHSSGRPDKDSPGDTEVKILEN